MEEVLSEIAIDARFLTTGLGTYTFNLLKNLNRDDRIKIRALTRQEHVEALAPYCDEFKIVTARMYGTAEHIAIARAASGCDLLHATHYNIPLSYRGAILVTIHDLTHLLDKSFKKTLKSMVYAYPMLRVATSRAAHIVTVSEYSKRNLIQLFGVPERRISVIHNGVGSEFYPDTPHLSTRTISQVLGLKGPYLLFIGNLKPHKNVGGLLRAFKLLSERSSFDQKLLIVGDDAVGMPSLVNLSEQLKLQERVLFAGWVGQQYVRDLYCGASMTIVPSFEEGFGLPVLESMACGTPVACSTAASMPEVGGDAVEYFDPASPESIATSIECLLSCSDRRAELRNRGIERAKKFSWEASGKAHLALYKALTN